VDLERERERENEAKERKKERKRWLIVCFTIVAALLIAA
jgi:flagellar basal body-associated protein FliL